MDNEKNGPRGRGGDRHPVPVLAFILAHLATAGEDYIANMHRAYKAELDNVARAKGRAAPYRHPLYHSFEVKVLQLVHEGKIEFTDREEHSDSARVKHLEGKPVRRFYRLAKLSPKV